MKIELDKNDIKDAVLAYVEKTGFKCNTVTFSTYTSMLTAEVTFEVSTEQANLLQAEPVQA